MASIGVDLGQLGLASTASGLQLQLNSHAEIASPEEGSDFDPCALITTERPWCRRGHGFRLSVSLSFDGEETGQSIEALGNAVAQQLGLAEQWHQFPLCPASIKHTITGTEEASIVVHLDYHNTKPPKRQLHKLEDGVPDHDRAPPIGANTVTLNLIHLAMRFSRTHSRKRRKLQPSLSEVSTNKAHPKAHYEGNGGACRRSKTSPVPECAIGEHADTPCEASRSSAQMLIEDATTARTSRKRSYSTGDLKVGGQISSIHDDLLELFDAGLRLAVTPHPSRLPKGIRIVANESFKHLAYSFPALWSPGHLAAVSGRAVFLPTVSHALANVCSLHAQNSVLRSKFAELSRQVTSSDRGSGISDRSPANEHGFSSTAQQSIATRVWETVQRTLFNKGGTCAKKPFSHCFEQELDEQGEDIWAEPMGLDNYSAEYQDIDDFLSDSEESMLDEEPLTPEPRAGHGTSLLWNECGASENHVPDYPTGHVAGQKRGSHVEQEHEDDELLSLCDSVGSLAIDAFMDVASSPGPEAWLMAAEEVVEKNLFDAEMEMDEFIPI